MSVDCYFLSWLVCSSKRLGHALTFAGIELDRLGSQRERQLARDEVIVLAGLRHPNVIRMLEYMCSDDGAVLSIVLEYADGGMVQ